MGFAATDWSNGHHEILFGPRGHARLPVIATSMVYARIYMPSVPLEASQPVSFVGQGRSLAWLQLPALDQALDFV